MIEDNTHTDDFKRKTHCANVGIRQKLIVRILEFYKNSVSKFLENKKLNVLDMGYTLTKHITNCVILNILYCFLLQKLSHFVTITFISKNYQVQNEPMDFYL